jgi:hypothetical protein
VPILIDDGEGRVADATDHLALPEWRARKDAEAGCCFRNKDGWMDGWMDGWIYGQTSEYDIRSSGGVAPDDERTRAT